MPATTVLSGAVVTLLRASAALAALVPATSIHTMSVPPEALLPLVLVEDTDQDPTWVAEQHRIEKHRLKVTIRAGETNTPSARNPAEIISDVVEEVLNWTDLPLPNSQPLYFFRQRKRNALEKRRGPPVSRVYKIEINWLVNFGLDG